jgi:ribosomal protein S13
VTINRNTPLDEITNWELSQLTRKFKKLKVLITRLLERSLYLYADKLISINCYRAMRARQGCQIEVNERIVMQKQHGV